MKTAVFILVFFMLFSFSVFGDISEVKTDSVTWETYNMLAYLRNSQADMSELKFYLSNPFSIFIMDENNEIPGLTISEGALALSEKGQSSTILISEDDEGRMITFPEQGSDIIELVFLTNDKLLILKFKRNTEKNNFVVFYAIINTREYYLHSHVNLPHLLIKSALDTNTNEIYSFISSNNNQTQPDSSIQPDNQTQPENKLQPDNLIQPDNQNQFENQHGKISRNILNSGSINPQTAAAYIISQNPNAGNIVERLIGTYISEANIEGINYDIAIAQMLHATDFLRNTQRVSSHNYAGFTNTKSWFGSFNNMPEGVRAHIQHLKGYASGAQLKNDLVAPRFQILAALGYLGTAVNFDDLYRTWTSDSAKYKTSVDRILNNLY